MPTPRSLKTSRMKSGRNRLSVVESTWRARSCQQPHTLLFVVSSPSMATAVSVDQTADRTALAREARHLADAMESLCGQLLKTGALVAIRRFMQLLLTANTETWLSGLKHRFADSTCPIRTDRFAWRGTFKRFRIPSSPLELPTCHDRATTNH